MDRRISVLATLALGVVLVSGCDQSPANINQQAMEVARPAKIVEATSSARSVKRMYPGTLAASRKASLAFRVDGQLEVLPVRSGHRVAQGDVLASLDDAVFANAVMEKEARYNLARIQFEQAEKLVKQNLGSQLQQDQAQAALKSAEAALQVARDNLRWSTLRAPFDGIVARVDVENHQAIKAKTPIIELNSDDQLDVHFSIPESLINKLRRVVNPEVINNFCGLVRFSAYPNKAFKACHKEHESLPDALTRTYGAVFTMPAITEFAALPGMTVNVELDFSQFLVGGVGEAVIVPVEALLQSEGKSWVWILDDEMRARRHEVAVGSVENDGVRITNGLVAGTPLIGAGVGHVREGMLVKPIVRERGL